MPYKDLSLSSLTDLYLIENASLNFIIYCLVPFILSFGALKLYMKLAPKYGLISSPNERSSHTKPTIVSGGIAFIPVLVLGLLYFVFDKVGFSFSAFISQPIILIALFTLCLSILGFIDDKMALSPKIRIILQMVFVALGIYFGLGTNFSLFNGAFSGPLLWIVLFLGWVWFINLYNFMDGIDGITSVQTLSILGGLFVMNSIAPEIFLLGFGVIIAFLVLNAPPSKLFMGDSGSLPLGYFLGFLLIKCAGTGVFGFSVALILPLYYLVDSGVTLVKRLKNGHKPWEAHREHFYQTLSGSDFISQKRFILGLAMLNIALIGVCYTIPSISYGAVGIALLFVVGFIFGFKMFFKKAV